MSSCVLPGLGKAESVWIGKSWQGGSQSHNSKITQVSHTSGKDGLGKGGGDIRRGFPLGGCCRELWGWTQVSWMLPTSTSWSRHRVSQLLSCLLLQLGLQGQGPEAQGWVRSLGKRGTTSSQVVVGPGDCLHPAQGRGARHGASARQADGGGRRGRPAQWRGRGWGCGKVDATIEKIGGSCKLRQMTSQWLGRRSVRSTTWWAGRMSSLATMRGEKTSRFNYFDQKQRWPAFFRLHGMIFLTAPPPLFSTKMKNINGPT